jgi:hypothetical protein
MLSNDICRCHDASCDVRESCERWLSRNDDGNWISHCMTMRDAGEKDCKNFIPQRPESLDKQARNIQNEKAR